MYFSRCLHLADSQPPSKGYGPLLIQKVRMRTRLFSPHLTRTQRYKRQIFKVCLVCLLYDFYSAALGSIPGFFSSHPSPRSPLRSSRPPENVLRNSSQNQTEQNLNRLLKEFVRSISLRQFPAIVTRSHDFTISSSRTQSH